MLRNSSLGPTGTSRSTRRGVQSPALGRNSTRHQPRLGTDWLSSHRAEKDLGITGMPSCVQVSSVLSSQTPPTAWQAKSGAACPASQGEVMIQRCTWNRAGIVDFMSIMSPRVRASWKICSFQFLGERKKKKEKTPKKQK